MHKKEQANAQKIFSLAVVAQKIFFANATIKTF